VERLVDLEPGTMAAEADRLHAETVRQDLAMARHGLQLIHPGERILTHCHTGSLATGGFGTALGVIKAAHAAGRRVRVLCGETRPLLQGARLTAWELERAGVPFHLITDSMAAHFIGRGEVDRVLVGADRVAMNGDTANKIGTRGIMLLARQAGIPTHVVAPTSTLDPTLATGDGIVIEERDGEEVRRARGAALSTATTPVRNPAFDITPGRAVTSFVTERGIQRPPLNLD
jgi:methylthioribose-1-phosphate isomerase